MAAIWTPFVTSLGVYLDLSAPKTESATANYISSLYRVAITTSSIMSIPGSYLLKIDMPSTEDKIAESILSVFDKIKSENKIEKETFSELSNSIIDHWKTSTWSITTFPPGFASAASAFVIDQGSSSLLNDSFYKVFKRDPSDTAGGVQFAKELSECFSSHMKTIKIKYIGVTPNGSPITTNVTGVV